MDSRESRRQDTRNLFALSAGHALEWFDWAMFGLLSVYIGNAFFPGDSPASSTLNSLAVFAVGFVARPIGGVVFGLVADRIGRKVVMIGSIGVTALASLIIGVLPTHEVLGVWAGIIVLVCRILQGISTGIEAPLSNAYGLELVPHRPGYVAGFMAVFNNLGNMLAPLTSFATAALLGAAAMGEYGWRVPFILGGLLGFVVLWLRRSLPETLVAPGEGANDVVGASRRTHTEAIQVWRGVRQYWLSVVAAVFIIGAIMAYNYTWLAGLPSLATGAYGEDPTGVFAVSTAMSIVLTVGAFVLSRVLDKWALSAWFVVGRLLAIPMIFLVLVYTGGGIGSLAAVMLGGSLVLVLNLTIFNTVANTLFPQHCRGTAMGIGYGIGVALFGGTASYLFVWLRSMDLGGVFPIYIAVLCAISVVLYLVAKRRNGIFIGS
ncbi:MFS transporter [Microbacterium aquimaris]|uniref:MFS transporter n=1 Tax=Microbacterium aquimaris TaxID=459816 RepID=UPI002AD510CD|nr:MFS transporter [Microbacterium aquimaris]MDZ8275352.1 MFS transporter [Microbacterium aquimaris]